MTQTEKTQLKLNYGSKANVDLTQLTDGELVFLTDKSVPIPETTDNGKVVSVNASGNYELTTPSTGPDTYLKSASVSENTLTLTKQDDTTVTFTPESGGGGGITEISTQDVWLIDLDTGIYKLTYSGTKKLYYGYAKTRTSVYTSLSYDNPYIYVVKQMVSGNYQWEAIFCVHNPNITKYVGLSFAFVRPANNNENFQTFYPNDYLKTTDIINSLTSTSTDDALSANQGRVLKGLVDEKSAVSGTNDGTNWTALTIDGTTKNIPSAPESVSKIDCAGTTPIQLQFWKGTQAEYDAISTKSDTTLYLVDDAPEPVAFDNITINYNNDNYCSMYYKLNDGDSTLITSSRGSGTLTLHNVTKLETKLEADGFGSTYVDGTNISWSTYEYIDLTQYLVEGSVVSLETDN